MGTIPALHASLNICYLDLGSFKRFSYFFVFFYFELMFSELCRPNFQLVPRLTSLSFWPPGSRPNALPDGGGPATRLGLGALTRSQSWASQWAGQFLSPQGWMARGLVSIWH